MSLVSRLASMPSKPHLDRIHQFHHEMDLHDKSILRIIATLVIPPDATCYLGDTGKDFGDFFREIAISPTFFVIVVIYLAQ